VQGPSTGGPTRVGLRERIQAFDGDFCLAVASKIKRLRAVAGKHLRPLAGDLSQNCPSPCQRLHATAFDDGAKSCRAPQAQCSSHFHVQTEIQRRPQNTT
jgi:hypothetical protein